MDLMTRFGALLLVTTLGCSGSASSAKLRGGDLPAVDGGVGGSFSLAGRGGSDQGGSSNVGGEDAGGGDAGEQTQDAPDAGAAGSAPTEDAGGQVAVGGQGGSDQGGSGGSSGSGGSEQGGSDQGGSDQGGAGGSDQGGSNQGGTGGDEPTPCVDGYHCDGLTLTVCDGGEEFVSQCGTLEEGLYCSETEGCYGDCVNGDVRCSAETAEACVDGAWTVTEECAFQCVAGACEGACTPETVVCDGLSLRTCGSDFHFGGPAACPTQEFFTTTCSAGACGLEPIACGEGTADCDSNGSCEASLSSVTSCGACGVACPAVDNASSNCNGSCGFACDDGFTDCDGDAPNGCEVQTASDSLNCGACGNSCYGGSCTDGVCEHAFEVVSDFSSDTFDGESVEMVVGPTHVYWWTYDGGENVLRRAPKVGGDFEVLTTFTTSSPPLARDNVLLVDGGLLYWATESGIYRMPETGGTPVQLTAFTAASLAISGSKLYWNDSQILSDANLCSDIPLRRTDVIDACNGTKVTKFFTLDLTTLNATQWQTTGNEYAPVLGVVGNEVFVTRFSFTGPDATDFSASIVALNVATGAFSRLIANGVRVDNTGYGMTAQFGQAVLSTTEIVFTTILRSDPSSGFYGLCRTPLGAVQPHLATTLVTQIQGVILSPEHLAADTTSVYLSNLATKIDRVSLADGSAAPFFGDTGSLSELAVDATHVYWTVESAAGELAILRAAK